MINTNVSKSLIGQFVIWFLVLIFSVSAVTSAVQYFTTYQSEQTIRDQSIDRRIEDSTPLLANALWKFDYEYLDVVINGLIAHPFISGLKLVDADTLKTIKEAGVIDAKEAKNYTIEVRQKSEYGDQTLAILTLYSDNNLIYQRINQTFLNLFVFALLLTLVIGSSLMLLVRRLVTHPLEQLSHTIEKFDPQHHQYWQHDPLLLSRSDEIGQVANRFNDLSHALKTRDRQLHSYQSELEELVKERTLELSRTNEELQASLSQLKRTQSDLVEAEKLAALGSVVAGVAHEINTPLGVTLTSVTSLAERFERVSSLFHQGQLTKEDMEQLIQFARNSNDISVKSLKSASALIQSFRQLHVDRSELKQQKLQIQSFLSEQEVQLRHLIQASKVKVVLRVLCHSRIQVTTYPSILAEIFKNLVQNALVHAFDEQFEEAEIILRAEEIEEPIRCLKLTISDNGVGMSEEIQQKAFQPFVSSRKFDGSTGLGLHLVHNLVKQILQGSIQIASKPNQGTRVEMIIPLESN